MANFNWHKVATLKVHAKSTINKYMTSGKKDNCFLWTTDDYKVFLIEGFTCKCKPAAEHCVYSSSVILYNVVFDYLS